MNYDSVALKCQEMEGNNKSYELKVEMEKSRLKDEISRSHDSIKIAKEEIQIVREQARKDLQDSVHKNEKLNQELANKAREYESHARNMKNEHGMELNKQQSQFQKELMLSIEKAEKLMRDLKSSENKIEIARKENNRIGKEYEELNAKHVALVNEHKLKVAECRDLEDLNFSIKLNLDQRVSECEKWNRDATQTRDNIKALEISKVKYEDETILR